MKRFIALLISMIAACVISAQVSTQNYIRNRKMLNNVGSSYLDDINYFDGLGRQFQSVNKTVQNNVAKQRLATLQEYDYYGRKTNSWLPIPVMIDYVETGTFKNTAQGSSGYDDSYPYNRPVYEASPLDRPLQQYGAGKLWSSNNRAVKAEYLANTTGGDLACKLYTANDNSLSGGTTCYAANLLNVIKTTDEDNNVSYTFTDKLERTVLTRQMNDTGSHDTYYIYDSKGNLCFVLQPMYQATANLELFVFQYKYDGHGNCIWKKLPGAEYVEYVYDDYDQMIYSQDGNQRKNSRWTYYQYDIMRRLIRQGECTGKNSSSSPVQHIVNFYDSYYILSQSGFNSSDFSKGNTSYIKGRLAGCVINVLDSSSKIYVAYFYDIKGRITQETRSNLLDGHDVTVTTYTFTDKPATVTHTHTASGKSTWTEVYTYSYDHADRISKVQHTLGGTKITLYDAMYDDLGRLMTKSLHGSTTNKLTYTYNLRGWLTGTTGTRFTQNLYYNTGVGTAKYNGSISSMTWKAGSESVVRGYKFTYDGLDRLLNGTYGEGNQLNSNSGRYSEKVIGYDKNGNITGLERYGRSGYSSYGMCDALTYTLNGNQVTRVDDLVSTGAGNDETDFKDIVKQANEYTYDANGNLTKDLNKGITGITYNCLNLPNVVTFSDGSTVTYTYSADGTKLRTVHKIGSTTTTTDYCGNVIYENNIAKLLLTGEGYISLNDKKYHYYLQDHQGNNRVVVDKDGNVEEVSHYYPFGGVFALSQNVQPYKYNGKELDTKKGLNWYDYGAREYDAVLGRFTTMDPSAENYYATNSYAYCGNNPVNRIDPDGKDWRVQTHYNRETDKIEYIMTVNAVLYNNSSNRDINMNQLATAITSQVTNVYNISENDFVARMNFNLKVVKSVSEIGERDHVIQIVNQNQLRKSDSKREVSAEASLFGLSIRIGTNLVERTLNGDNVRTVAHELGHTGGLKHLNDKENTNNLMMQSYYVDLYKGNYNAATLLYHNQIKAIRDNYINNRLHQYSPLSRNWFGKKRLGK